MTTQAVEETDQYVSSVDLSHCNGATVAVDFAVHYVVCPTCQRSNPG